jgi:DNA-binding NarL/FixJ family response regulator
MVGVGRSRMSRKEICFLTVEAGETGLSTRKLVIETAGYNCVSAVTAQEGLKLLEMHPIAAVILDTDVTDLPPADFIKQAKRSRPELPVYFLAKQNFIPRELEGQVAGVIEKMSDPRHMVEHLQAVFPG